MQPHVPIQESAQIVGAQFPAQRLESVTGALLELPPAAASQVAAEFFRERPEQAPLVLATLFSVRDLETPHRIIADCGVDWAPPLQLLIRGLMVNDLEQQGLLPCRDQRASSEKAVELYDRYLMLGGDLFRREAVIVPMEFSVEKFMLLEHNGELYFRVGGRYHRDVVSSMIRELLECGQAKSASHVAPRGGGLLMLNNHKLTLFGESFEYGKADMERARELLASSLASVPVTVR